MLSYYISIPFVLHLVRPTITHDFYSLNSGIKKRGKAHLSCFDSEALSFPSEWLCVKGIFN